MNATRRTILAGLAVAPVASLPAIAAPADPVFAALTQHRRARVAMDAAYAVSARLSNIFSDARRELGIVTYRGEEVHDFTQLEWLRNLQPKGMSDEDVERAIADFRRGNMAIQAEAAEPDLEYEAARAALLERAQVLESALANVRDAEQAEDEPFAELLAAECAVLEARPSTRAGAAALLRYVADRMASDSFTDGESELTPDAIRAAVAILEREARA